MAVYRRAYKPWAGPHVPGWRRFLVLPRYASENLFRSRILTGYMVLCLVPAIVAAAIIYIYNSPAVQTMIGLTPGRAPFSIDARFFYWLLRIQGAMAFLLTAWVGPTLVAPDLANGALPLYLSRPFSRAEYVLGKAATLVILLSAIMWVPDLFLYAFQAGLAGDGWFWSNWHIAWAIFASSAIWIAVLSLLALAMSAWVKWRIVASGLLVAIFFVAAGFGQVFNLVLRTYWGYLLNLSYLISIVWYDLFDVPTISYVGRRWVGTSRDQDIPAGIAWVALLAICGLCLMLLNKRLRAREVVKG